MDISIDKYWENTLQLCKLTLDMLSTFEGNNYALVEETIEPLRKLIQQGSDLESLKAYQKQQRQQQQETSSSSSSSSCSSSGVSKGKQLLVPRSNVNNNNQLQQEQEQFYQNQNWTKINEKTMHISNEKTDTVIVAKAVTTPEELEELITKIKTNRIAALDCEFIALRKAPPQLQLLQVAVSATEGYAIVIDKVGVDIVDEKLRSVLEDSDINYVGWAFRGDALAIESTIKGISLAPVLDLQAKLRPVAVEEMNLYAAMTKYAPEWDALEEFQQAKMLGETFNYYQGDCIWLRDPLPPAALAYSVFDVVSLMVLLNAIEQYPTTEDHYWPYTVIKTSGRKSLRNWQRQRAQGFSAPIIDTKDLKNQGGLTTASPSSTSYNSNSNSNTNNNFSVKRGYKNQRKNFNFVQSNDPEAQYEEDLQKALLLSIKENRNPQSHNYASSSKEDRVIDFEPTDTQYSALYDGDDDLNNLRASGSGSSSSAMPCFGPPPNEEDVEVVEYTTWGDIVNEKQKPFLGLAFEEKFNMEQKDTKSFASSAPSSSSASKLSSAQPNQDTVEIMKRPTTASTTITAPEAATAIKDKEQEKSLESPNLYSKDTGISSPTASSNNDLDRPTPATSSDVQEMFSFKSEIARPQDKTFDSKPDMSNYAAHINAKGGVIDQTGVFTWDDGCSGGGEAWKAFAQTASSGWINNEDTDLSAIDTIKPVTTPKKREEIRFNTSANNNWYNKDAILSSEYNEWDVLEERPTLMRMPITKFESSRKFTGPKCVNPTDTGYTDESDDNDDDDDDDDDDDNGNENTSNKNNSNNNNSNSNDGTNDDDDENSVNGWSNSNSNKFNKRNSVDDKNGWSNINFNKRNSGDDKSGWSNNKFNKRNSEEEKDISVTSPNGSESHFKSPDSSHTNRYSWSSKGSSSNGFSRQSSYDRNNNNSSRQYRYSTGHNYDRSSYQGNSYNNSNYNNNSNSYKNYNNKYKNNYNNYNNYNYNDNSNYNSNKYHNSSNNNYNKWQNRNSTSSTSSNHSTPQPNQSRQPVNTTTTSSSTDVYELEIYVNEFYINTGEYIKLFKITQPSHLDMIILPPLEEKFTVAITYHLTPSNNEVNGFLLKAIQFYLGNNESYNVILSQACYENNPMNLDSKFTTLLTHPNINRIAWFPQYFVEQLKKKTNIDVGRIVDLGVKAHAISEGCDANFISVLSHYLKDWPTLEQFTSAKREYDVLSQNKFIDIWDKDNLPDSALEYSALQGASLFRLYYHSYFISTSDEDYIYKQK